MSDCILAVSKNSMPFCLYIRSLLRLLDLLPFVLQCARHRKRQKHSTGAKACLCQVPKEAQPYYNRNSCKSIVQVKICERLWMISWLASQCRSPSSRLWDVASNGTPKEGP